LVQIGLFPTFFSSLLLFWYRCGLLIQLALPEFLRRGSPVYSLPRGSPVPASNQSFSVCLEGEPPPQSMIFNPFWGVFFLPAFLGSLLVSAIWITCDRYKTFKLVPLELFHCLSFSPFSFLNTVRGIICRAPELFFSFYHSLV